MLIGSIDIIKTSWSFYVKNWKKFISYLMLLFVPTIILTSLGILSAYYASYTEGLYLISALVVLVVFIVSALFSLWVSIALMQTIKHAYKNEPLEDWKKTISDNSYLIWPVFLTSLLTTILVVIGSILFLIPGLIFFIWYMFTFYEVIFNNKRGLEALKASKSLVVGRWWAILWRILIPSLAFGVLMAIIVGAVLFPIKFLIPETSTIFEIISNIISTIINLALTPLVSTAMLVLYFSAVENPVAQFTPPTNEPPKEL